MVHVEDVARTFQAVLEAPLADIHNQALNNGAGHLNHQVRELAEIAAGAVPGCEVEIRGEASADQRTYKADFSKFARTFPDFEFQWTAETGAQDLADAFRRIGLTYDQYKGERFTRLKWLTHLLESRRLDGSLRWSQPAEVRE